MTRKSFLITYFVTLVISIVSLLFLSWLLVQALNKNSQLDSQHNLLISQLKVAQEAVKRFEKRQESEADQQRQYDDLESKYLKILTANQTLESENISQRAKLKELSELNVRAGETLQSKLKEQRDILTREHANRVRKLKMMFKREKSALMQAQSKEVNELKQSLKKEKDAEVSSIGLTQTERAAMKFQLDDLRAENLRLKESLKTGQSKNIETPVKNSAPSGSKKNEASKKMISEAEVERLKQENAITHYNLGVVQLKNRKYEEALKEFKYSLTLNPNDPLTHYNLAYIYESYFKDFANAIHHYQDYLRLNPDAKDISQVEEQLLRLQMRKEVGVEGVLKVSK